MSSGKRDDNRVVVLIGVSSVDGVTPVPIMVDPDTGRLLATIVSRDASDGTVEQPTKRDYNRVTVSMGADSTDNTNPPIPTTIDTEENGWLVEI